MGRCLLRRITQRSASFRRGQQGAVAVEFALVAIPFFFMIASILELAIVMFTEYSLQNAVQDAGRLMRINQVDNGAALRDEICERAGIPDCVAVIGINVQVAQDFAGLVPPGIAQVAPGSTIFSSGMAHSAVIITATHDWRFTVPFLGPFANAGDNTRRLAARAVFRNEPF
jgi:Flp pilus assembly protein TadG